MTLRDVSKVISGTECICIFKNGTDEVLFNGEESQTWRDLNWESMTEYFDAEVLSIETSIGNEDSEFSFAVIDICIKM